MRVIVGSDEGLTAGVAEFDVRDAVVVGAGGQRAVGGGRGERHAADRRHVALERVGQVQLVRDLVSVYAASDVLICATNTYGPATPLSLR